MNLSKSLCACLRTSCVFSALAKWLPHNWTYHTVSPVEKQNLVVWVSLYKKQAYARCSFNVCLIVVAALCVCQSTVWQPSMSQVIQLLRLQETSYMVKADRLKRLMFRLHDFQYAAMDDDQQQEQQEEYSRSEESWLAVSSGSSNGI
ncbi:unnamed protein product [Sphagnum jensenii]